MLLRQQQAIRSEAITFPDLHPAQSEIVNCPARFVVGACGRRFGKTEGEKVKLMRAILNTNAPYFYVLPTHTDMLDMWESMIETMRPRLVARNKSERVLRFDTGAELWFFSAVAIERALGHKFAGGVFDESAKMPNLEFAWVKVIRATLVDLKGWAHFISSFKGRNYFWHLFNMGNDPAFPDWKSFAFSTSDNPYIDPAEIEAAQREMPEREFNEEFLSIPADDYGAVFRNVLACIRPTATRTGDVVFGVDWGRHNDFTAIAVMDKGTRALLELDRFNQVDWTLQRGRLQALYNKYKPSLIVAESNSIGEPNIEELQKAGLPVEGFATTASSKPPLIDALALAFEQGSVGLPEQGEHIPVMVAELQSYEMERLPSGTFRYGAPSGGHDDTVIALALALYACGQRGSTVSLSPVVIAPSRGRR